MSGAIESSVIRATASHLPERSISNRDITELLIAGSSPNVTADEIRRVRERAEEIERKTGLVERRFFATDTSPVDVTYDLLLSLVNRAKLDWSDLDGVIVSSSSVHGFPGLSQQVVAKARTLHPSLRDPFVLDIGSNACTSFLYGVGIADALIRAQGSANFACLAVEFSSRCLQYDIQSFATSTLFGDAAAGLILSKEGVGPLALHSVHLKSQTDDKRITFIRGGGLEASNLNAPASRTARWYVNGPSVALDAIEILVSEVDAFRRRQLHVDWLIPHQANLTRILYPACDRLGLPRDRLCHSFARTGNTSSASIPLLLDDLLHSGRIRPSDSIALISFGGSFSVGSAYLRAC